MAESISLYHSKTRQSLEEVAPVSDADRIKLLEDAFAQMRRAQPQTLVSGIGASLDSGGGAVWLWDLEDVNIGTPLNGNYPVISDNSILKFDSATAKWVVGSAEDSGQDLPLSGGTMTGDINFNSGQTFPGTLELAGGTMTGDITFKAGQTFPGTLPLTGGAITGDTTYTGSTAGATNLQTQTSVNALISAAVTDGFTFKGTCDVTQSLTDNDPDVVAAAGNFYINTTAGAAESSWTGIAGLSISADQLVIYSGAESRWFAGAVENNSSFLAKTGGTMTGDIVFAGTQTFPSSITSGFLQKSGGTMTGTLITDEIQVPLGKTLTIKRGNSNTSSSGLDIKGYQPGQFNTQTDILAVSYGNGTSTGDSINYKGRTDGTNNLQTKGSVQSLIDSSSSTSGNLAEGGVIKSTGGTINNSGSLTIEETGASGSGKLIIKDDTNNENIVLKPSGEIDASTVKASSSLVVNNALGNPLHTLSTNGTAILGSVIEIGSSNANQTTKAINLFGSSKPSLSLTTQASGGSVQEIVSFSSIQTFFQTAIKVGPVGGASNFLLTTDGAVDCKGITCTGLTANGSLNVSSSSTFTGTATAMGDFALAKAAVTQSFNIRGAKLKELLIYAPDNSGSGDGTLNQVMRLGYTQNKSLRPFEISGNNTNGSDSLAQTGRLSFTGSCDDGFIGKSGGTNNMIKIGGGGPSTSHVVATIGVLENGKRTFTSSLSSTDFIGTTTVWNKAVAQSYNVVSGTSATYDDNGVLTAATVAAPITFSGNNIHSGTVTHNADFTIGTNHVITLNSPIFMSNGDYNFSSTSGSHTIQKIRNKGQASKVLMITATDTGNAEQDILNISHAGSEFFRPITVPTPTANGHAATKAYIDALETKIADALTASSDYGAFKTALLAALG
jgi:hypothetical protein